MASEKRCQCAICRVSQEFQRETPDLQVLSDGVDGILDIGLAAEMNLAHLLNTIKDRVDRGRYVPGDILSAVALVMARKG